MPRGFSGVGHREEEGIRHLITFRSVRSLALSLPEAEEHEHWGRPSFRVRKKIFATLWEDEQRAVLKLSLDEQDAFVRSHPETFSAGSWSHQGWTNVDLRKVDAKLFRELLVASWRRLAGKRLAAQYDANLGAH